MNKMNKNNKNRRKKRKRKENSIDTTSSRLFLYMKRSLSIYFMNVFYFIGFSSFINYFTKYFLLPLLSANWRHTLALINICAEVFWMKPQHGEFGNNYKKERKLFLRSFITFLNILYITHVLLPNNFKSIFTRRQSSNLQTVSKFSFGFQISVADRKNIGKFLAWNMNLFLFENPWHLSYTTVNLRCFFLKPAAHLLFNFLKVVCQRETDFSTETALKFLFTYLWKVLCKWHSKIKRVTRIKKQEFC